MSLGLTAGGVVLIQSFIRKEASSESWWDIVNTEKYVRKPRNGQKIKNEIKLWLIAALSVLALYFAEWMIRLLDNLLN